MLKSNKEEFREATGLSLEAKPQTGLGLAVDVGMFQHCIDDPNVSDEEKAELIEAVWSIVNSCIDLSIGIHPVQQAVSDPDLMEALKLLAADDPFFDLNE